MKNNKSLGQHWLKNRAVLETIAELAVGDANEDTDGCGMSENGGDKDISGHEKGGKKGLVCVEIGPGLGFLTSSLLKRFDKVIAVEYDAELACKLPGSFPGKNLEVVSGDILEFDFGTLSEPYVVAGNIPYYITSPIIEKVLLAKNMPERVVILMQKEVAERILSDKETVLSLFVKNRAAVMAGPVVKAEEFTPPPKVDSQVVVFEPFANGPIVSDEVFALIRRGFASPRKKLVHNLVGTKSREELMQILESVELSPNARPGDLRLADWASLYEKIQ